MDTCAIHQDPATIRDQLPQVAQAGSFYTLYWVWQLPTAPRIDYKGNDEYYTSCVDVDVVSSMQSDHGGPRLKQQDPMPTAVPGFESRSALTLDPLALYSAGFGAKSDSTRIATATMTVASFHTVVPPIASNSIKM
jgi:hypothetical protein